jgi:hypothetical protein
MSKENSSSSFNWNFIEIPKKVSVAVKERHLALMPYVADLLK